MEHFNFLSLATAVEEVISSVGLMHLHFTLEATAQRETETGYILVFKLTPVLMEEKTKHHQPCSQEPHDSLQPNQYLSFRRYDKITLVHLRVLNVTENGTQPKHVTLNTNQ